MALVSILLTGVLYPLAVWAVGAVAFRDHAAGSMVTAGGTTVGSSLIGQSFTAEEYFHSRPSASDYDPMRSGPTNLGPTSKTLIESVTSRVDAIERAERLQDRGVPVDLVTASASGLDPHISPDSAYLQVGRVAEARALSEDTVRALVEEHVEGRQLGVLGEPRVNVLVLNMALDEMR
jgi:K+-transporting ATPase ATPase C chain